MTPSRNDTQDVQSAASKLTGQAQTLSARHLNHGCTRIRFNREVAYYAKRITDDVQVGRKTREQGMQALLQEQRSLLIQSNMVMRNGQSTISDAVTRIPAAGLTKPKFMPDPERLLRFVHAQQLEVSSQQSATTTSTASRPAPLDNYKMRSREEWPAAVELYEPGFYIAPKSTTLEKLQAQLFRSPTTAVLTKFRALNPGLDQIKAGQMIVLSDPDNPQCTEAEAKLMSAAYRVNEALADLDQDEADFMVRHRDEIETFLTRGSTSIGIGEAILANHLKSVESLFKEIDNLHTSTFKKHGNLHSAEFFRERKRLLALLDDQLTSLTKKGIGFPDHPKLKTALGISSRSLVHRWGRAGGVGMNPGYATHLAGVTKAAKYLKYGGYLGIAIGGGASVMKVQDVCGAGDSEACRKVKYTEGGNFLGVVAAGVGIGAASSAVAGPLCLALGAATVGAGLVVCGIVVVGVASSAGGIAGGAGGERLGEAFYEVTK